VEGEDAEEKLSAGCLGRAGGWPALTSRPAVV